MAGIAIRLRTGRAGVRIPVGIRDYFLLQNVQTSSEVHPTSSPVGTVVKRLEGKANH